VRACCPAAAELLGVALQRDLATQGGSTVCGLTEGSPGWKPNTSSANDRCGKALRSCRELGMKGIKRQELFSRLRGGEGLPCPAALPEGLGAGSGEGERRGDRCAGRLQGC